MPELPAPNVGADLTRIHTIVTRSLDLSIERCRAIAAAGWPDDSTPEGLLNYVRCLESFLGAHHSGEDELLFPYFAAKLPDFPLEQLKQDHLLIEEHLSRLGPAADTVEANVESPGDCLCDLATVLAGVRDLWGPHIQVEETHLGAQVVGPLLPAEEHVRLSRLSAEHSQKNSGPDYLVVPFVLYNLAPEQRAVIARAMPPIVTEQLVPITWADRWASMKPFLLD